MTSDKRVRFWLTKSEWSRFPYSKEAVGSVKTKNVQGVLNGFNQLTSLVPERIDWFERGKHLLTEEELAELDDMPDKDSNGIKRFTRSNRPQRARLNWDYVCKPWNSGTYNWSKNWYRIYLSELAKKRLEELVKEAKDKELYNQLTNLGDDGEAIRQFLRDNEMTIDDAQALLVRHDHHDVKEGVISTVLDEEKNFEYYFGPHGENYEQIKTWWYTIKTKEKPLLWMFEQFSKGGHLQKKKSQVGIS